MADKPFMEMDEPELTEQMKIWSDRVHNASGPSSAIFAARQCELVESAAYSKGFSIPNPHKITYETEGEDT